MAHLFASLKRLVFPSTDNTSSMTAQLLPHLQPFTPQSNHHSLSHFRCFPDLPAELRRKIWRHSLERERIIRMLLYIDDWNEIHNPTGKAPYSIIVSGHQALSKLLRLNQESRKAALEFYRVHIPCQFSGTEKIKTSENANTTPGTFYFNPEFDFLKIYSQWLVKDTLLDFIHRLKTVYDPRHIGLLNLAVTINDLNANDHFMVQPADVNPEVRKSFTDTLNQLQEVFFLSTRGQGRQILGWTSNISGDTILTRSIPIAQRTPTFERLGRDPRAIAEDLTHIYLDASSLKDVITLWQRMLKKWGASPPNIQYRLYVAFAPHLEDDRIYDRTTAESWLQKEDYKLKRIIEFPEEYPGAKPEKYKNEDLEKAVRPAFGFWLFPIESLDQEDDSKELLDLSGFWPDLALKSLPG